MSHHKPLRINRTYYFEDNRQNSQSDLKTKPEKQRIEYIDLVKGISILWVVLLHSGFSVIDDFKEISWYNWLFAPYRMSLFFFISGIFFRLRTFSEFFKRRIKTLIVPFFGFWLAGLLYNVIKYELLGRYTSMKYKGLGSFTEYATSLKGLFYLRPEVDPCIVNGVLWFLIALFIVQMVHFFLCKLIPNKLVILFVGMILFVASAYLIEQEITGLFYVTNICGLYVFYILGNFWGNNLIKILENKGEHVRKMLILCALILIAISFADIQNLVLSQISLFIRTICFFPIVFAICKSTNDLNITKPLKYFGRHSLELLVTHTPLLNLINILVFKLVLNWPHEKVFQYAGLSMFLAFFLCVVLEYLFVIRFCNKYLYMLLGKPRDNNAR